MIAPSAVARSWGECAWTSKDLLKQRVTVQFLGKPEPEVRYVPVFLLPTMRVQW